MGRRENKLCINRNITCVPNDLLYTMYPTVYCMSFLYKQGGILHNSNLHRHNNITWFNEWSFSVNWFKRFESVSWIKSAALTWDKESVLYCCFHKIKQLMILRYSSLFNFKTNVKRHILIIISLKSMFTFRRYVRVSNYTFHSNSFRSVKRDASVNRLHSNLSIWAKETDTLKPPVYFNVVHLDIRYSTACTPYYVYPFERYWLHICQPV